MGIPASKDTKNEKIGPIDDPDYHKKKLISNEITQKIVHISDIHIGYDGGSINYKTELLFKWLEEHYKETEPKPLIVFSGDCVHHGKEEDMKVFMKYLDILKEFPIRITVGNHDIGYEGVLMKNSSHKIYKDMFKDYMIPFREQKKASLIVVDSLQGRDNNLWSDGGIGKEQFMKMKEFVEEDEHNYRILMMHHHPFFMGPLNLCRLDDHKEFLEFVFNHNIELVLFGHKHIQNYWRGYRNRKITYFVSAPSSVEKDNHKKQIVQFLEINLSGKETAPIVYNYQYKFDKKKVYKILCPYRNKNV